jgi:hypothetical protein
MTVLRSLVVAFAALAVAGCSTTAYTSLDKSWVDPKLAGTKFKKVLILSLASDEFAQQYFQQDIAAALKKRGVNAVASQGYFTHPSPSEDARFKRVIAESDADAVLLARVIGVDEKTTVTGGYLTTPTGVPTTQVYGLGNVVASTFAPTRYVRPSDYTQATVLVETVLYEAKSKQAVWSAQTSTKNAQSGDLKPAIAQFVGVLVGAMDRDGLF